MWDGLITSFGGVLLMAYGFGWLAPGRGDLLTPGWRIGMKICGSLMLVEGLLRIMFAASP